MMKINSCMGWVWIFTAPPGFALSRMNKQLPCYRRTSKQHGTAGREGKHLTTDGRNRLQQDPIFCSLKECTFFILGRQFFYDGDTLCNYTVLCLINDSSQQTFHPSAAFKVGSFTALHVGSATVETKKEPMSLCQTRGTTFSPPSGPVKECFQSSQSNSPISQHSIKYIKASALPWYPKLWSEPITQSKWPPAQFALPHVRLHLYSLALQQVANN